MTAKAMVSKLLIVIIDITNEPQEQYFAEIITKLLLISNAKVESNSFPNFQVYIRSYNCLV